MFIKKKISEKLIANKKHINSSLFLFSINVFNFIFPLLLSPIIISRCGVEGFGIVTMFQSIMLFTSSITDYAFNINGTREATIRQKEKGFINQLFFAVTYSKTFLLVIALLIVIAIYLIIPIAKENTWLYFSSITILIGRAYNPLWILRAIHKMKFIFYFYVFFKLLSILVIYFFLNKISDLYLVNLVIGFSDLLTCVFATLTLYFNLNWRYFSPSIDLIKNEIYSGIAVFTQIISINANAYLNPMILGFFVDPYTLGIYCIVEKIILVIKFCASFVLQSVFPKACELSIQNRISYKKFLKNFMLFLIISMTIAGILLTLKPELIVSYFIKSNIIACSKFLVFNAWIPLIVALNMIPFLNFMVYNKQKETTIVFVISVIINVILNTFLTKFYGIYGTTVSVYVSETFITVSLWILLKFKYSKS